MSTFGGRESQTGFDPGHVTGKPPVAMSCKAFAFASTCSADADAPRVLRGKQRFEEAASDDIATETVASAVPRAKSQGPNPESSGVHPG